MITNYNNKIKILSFEEFRKERKIPIIAENPIPIYIYDMIAYKAYKCKAKAKNVV